MDIVAEYFKAQFNGVALPPSYIHKAIDEIKSLRQQLAKPVDGWLPIETAPKTTDINVIDILLLCQKNKICIGYWDLYYAEGGNGYEDGLLAWIIRDSGERVDMNYDAPTHWMPLPAPPVKD